MQILIIILYFCILIYLAKLNVEIMDKNSLVASKIREIRIKKNLLQKHIAHHLGISENAFSRLENGHTKINIGHLYLIADALDCSIEEILDLKNDSNCSNSLVKITPTNDGSYIISLCHHDFLKLKTILDTKNG